MSILDRLVDLTTTDEPTDDHTGDARPYVDTPVPDERDGRAARRRGEPIRAERNHEDVDHLEPDAPEVAHDERAPRPAPGRQPVGVRGMRIERVRVGSVATIASVFFALGYLTILGTLVVVWNAALAFGFVDSLEATVTTSLGLDDRFTLVGQDLFELAVVGVGLLVAFWLALTVLLALVYNVTCWLFGGLAVETGPLRRRHRVFSWRHRRFVTLRK